MGTEMSCPCGTRPQIKEETSSGARVCLLENDRIELFFNNKKFFKYDKVNEVE